MALHYSQYFDSSPCESTPSLYQANAFDAVRVIGFPSTIQLDEIRIFFNLREGPCICAYLPGAAGYPFSVAIRFGSATIAKRVLFKYNNASISGHKIQISPLQRQDAVSNVLNTGHSMTHSLGNIAGNFPYPIFDLRNVQNMTPLLANFNMGVASLPQQPYQNNVSYPGNGTQPLEQAYVSGNLFRGHARKSNTTNRKERSVSDTRSASVDSQSKSSKYKWLKANSKDNSKEECRREKSKKRKTDYVDKQCEQSNDNDDGFVDIDISPENAQSLKTELSSKLDDFENIDDEMVFAVKAENSSSVGEASSSFSPSGRQIPPQADEVSKNYFEIPCGVDNAMTLDNSENFSSSAKAVFLGGGSYGDNFDVQVPSPSSFLSLGKQLSHRGNNSENYRGVPCKTDNKVVVVSNFDDLAPLLQEVPLPGDLCDENSHDPSSTILSAGRSPKAVALSKTRTAMCGENFAGQEREDIVRNNKGFRDAPLTGDSRYDLPNGARDSTLGSTGYQLEPGESKIDFPGTTIEWACVETKLGIKELRDILKEARGKSDQLEADGVVVDGCTVVCSKQGTPGNSWNTTLAKDNPHGDCVKGVNSEEASRVFGTGKRKKLKKLRSYGRGLGKNARKKLIRRIVASREALKTIDDGASHGALSKVKALRKAGPYSLKNVDAVCRGSSTEKVKHERQDSPGAGGGDEIFCSSNIKTSASVKKAKKTRYDSSNGVNGTSIVASDEAVKVKTERQESSGGGNEVLCGSNIKTSVPVKKVKKTRYDFSNAVNGTTNVTSDEAQKVKHERQESSGGGNEVLCSSNIKTTALLKKAKKTRYDSSDGVNGTSIVASDETVKVKNERQESSGGGDGVLCGSNIKISASVKKVKKARHDSSNAINGTSIVASDEAVRVKTERQESSGSVEGSSTLTLDQIQKHGKEGTTFMKIIETKRRAIEKEYEREAATLLGVVKTLASFVAQHILNFHSYRQQRSAKN